MLETGRLIGERYEIKEKIGTGGMADVYKAFDTRLNRMVAIKVLKQEFSEDKSFITRFKNEAQAAAGLSHPNIVGVYDVGEDKGSYYIVMELINGVTLKKFIEKKGKLDVREAVAVAIQIAQGMEAAHKNKIIHRDIKPQNIMISRDGKVKVSDFGIAKIVSSDTFVQNAVGSAHYLSPEQARGGYSDARSDIYSLGVTLYEMLTGKTPFSGDSDVNVAIKHIKNEARPVREIVPDVPYSLDMIVRKCMQKHPDKRYSSATELIEDLKLSIKNPEGEFVNIKNDADAGTRNFTNEEAEEIKTRVSSQKKDYPEEPKVIKAKNSYNSRRLSKEDYEEIDTIDSKFEKVVIVIAIFAALAVIGGAALIFVKLFGGLDFGNSKNNITPTPVVYVTATPVPTSVTVSTLSMPNLYGYTKEDAEALLMAKSPDFVIVYEDSEYSSQDAGTVIKQYPLASTDVLTNGTVRLTLSAGGKPITVPKVVGLTEANARSQLETVGFNVQITYEPSEQINSGLVTRTNPANGIVAHDGDSIIVYVSTGVPIVYVEMPDIIGKSTAVAKEMLEAVGLKCSDVVKTDYSNIIEYGLVMAQSVLQKTVVSSETMIELTISLGPYPEDTEFKEYYTFSIDTTKWADKFTAVGEAQLVFGIYQTGVSYEKVVYVDYDNESLIEQYYKVTYDTFPGIYDFKLYKDFYYYEGLHAGNADITIYINDEAIGFETVELKEVTNSAGIDN